MASSRIFVKGLPPTFDEAQFRKHFGQKRQITDAKIFPNRRIGYVGYKTSEDAEQAVKYFNKTFIRMSRIGVEMAKPIDESLATRRHPTAKVTGANQQTATESKKLKRKRDSESKPKDDTTENDPKLKEFLDSYKSKSDKKALENQAMVAGAEQDEEAAVVEAGESDDEYEQVPKKTKRTRSETKPIQDTPMQDAAVEVVKAEAPSGDAAVDLGQDESNDIPAVSDADWARSRTSRLLGLLEDEEEEEAVATKPAESDSEAESPRQDNGPDQREKTPAEPESSIPTPPAEDDDEHEDQDIKQVRTTMRLFVRNLPYDVKYEDLEAQFEPFGNLEQVSDSQFISPVS